MTASSLDPNPRAQTAAFTSLEKQTRLLTAAPP